DTSSAKRTLWSGSPFAALGRRIGGSGSVYVSYSSAFRMPSMSQLYDLRPIEVHIPPFVDITSFLSNGTLKPQYAHSLALGGRVERSSRSSLVLTLYSIGVLNEIDFDQATLRYANIQRSWHRGVQLGIEQGIGASITARISGTYSPTTLRDPD